MGVEKLNTKVRKAFKAMHEGKHLYNRGQEQLDVGSSDIAFPVSDFPSSRRTVGEWFWGEDVPKKVRDTDGIAFRAELRRGDGKYKDRYLAIMWESYSKKPTEYQVTYYTNYSLFMNRRESQYQQDRG